MRIIFEKGKQRKFIDLVMLELGCPSLRELINRGIAVDYSSLKNYHTERRCLPENLFKDLCKISGINGDEIIFRKLGDFWGQSKGGRKSRK